MRRALASPLAAAVATLAALACSDAPRPLPLEPRAAVSASAMRIEDLTIQSFTVSPAQPGTADPVTLTATVTNGGDAKAKKFDVLFNYGNGMTEVVTVNGGLAAGASVTVSTTPRTVAAGSYTATVTADYNLKVKESDETNNSATAAYRVGPHPITFETDASGNPICASGCDLTTEYANLGVTFSFAAQLDGNGNPLSTKTNASICDGSRIDPPDLVLAGNHVVTGPMGYPCGGGVAGTLTMTFSGAPTEVRFLLRTPSGCNLSPISATGTGGTTPTIAYTTTRTYPYNGLTDLAVEQEVVVTNATGITSIAVNISGCDYYIDDLLITP